MTQVMPAPPEKAHDIQPLLIDEEIPAVTFATMDGEPFDLKAAIAEQPTVLFFYRGSWCGYCKKQMVEMRQNRDRFAALGYQILAVSPDLPENTREMDDKFKPGFPLLCDPKMDATHAFGLAWKVSDRDDEYYEKLRRASGETHRLLPVPAVLIVSREGVIQFEYINPNYKVRPPVELILAAAEAVNKLEADAE